MKQTLSFSALVAGLLVLMATACGSKKDTQADALFQQAVEAYNAQDYATAQELIDSLHRTYVTRVDLRRSADTIAWRMDLLNIKQQSPVNDSLLEVRCAEAEAMAKNFKYEKDEQYQDLGIYEHTRLATTNNTSRSYLHASTDEHGKFSLLAQYVGKPINFRAVVVEFDKARLETETVDESSCNVFSRDGGSNCETVLFDAEMMNNLPAVVADNCTKETKVTVVYKGDTDFSYTMSSADFQAFIETYRLSQLLKEIHELQVRKDNNAKRLVLLQERLQEL